MSWPDGERYLRPPQSLVVSILLSLVSALLFSRTEGVSFCTVQQRTLCAAHSLAALCLFTTSGPGPGMLSGFWGSMFFRDAPIPRKGSGKQQHLF